MREFAQGTAPSNGIDSCKSVLRRAHQGTYRKYSGKVVASYTCENTADHHLRDVTLAGTPANLPAIFRSRDVP